MRISVKYIHQAYYESVSNTKWPCFIVVKYLWYSYVLNTMVTIANFCKDTHNNWHVFIFCRGGIISPEVWRSTRTASSVGYEFSDVSCTFSLQFVYWPSDFNEFILVKSKTKIHKFCNVKFNHYHVLSFRPQCCGLCHTTVLHCSSAISTGKVKHKYSVIQWQTTYWLHFYFDGLL